MLQAPVAATVATVQDTGPRTAESCCLPPQTEAASIIQTVPQVLGPDQEVLPMEAQSDGGDNVLFVQLSEVKGADKFEEDILCLQFFLLVCPLHLTFLQNV